MNGVRDMDRITERDNRHNYWRTMVEEQEKSGLSQVKFCKQHELVLSQFGYYRSLFRPSKLQTTPVANHFTPIQLNMDEEFHPLDRIKVVLPNGFQCILPMHISVKQVKSLLEVFLAW